MSKIQSSFPKPFLYWNTLKIGFSYERTSMMDTQSSCSDRTEITIEANDVDEIYNHDGGAALSSSPSSRSYDEKYFADNFSTIRRAIQSRNAYAV
ncbi:hypothetical protein NPIL_233821 [Nephila pilipes]|uniref:Uncharacterized protein n=1 Tax=Nephila pilipes TaxID=299642 RepID=A0A8X6U1C3_NEPPI|nr:hypothetical protein NPIL_233821 [Nephila pilipes]